MDDAAPPSNALAAYVKVYREFGVLQSVFGHQFE